MTAEVINNHSNFSKTTKQKLMIYSGVNTLLHKHHFPGFDFDENLAVFSTKSSVLPACPVIEKSCSKPPGLCKFSVSTQTFS